MSAWRTLRILRFNAVRPHTHGIFQRYAEALWLGSVILGKCECMERQRAANNSSEKAWQFHRSIFMLKHQPIFAGDCQKLQVPIHPLVIFPESPCRERLLP